MALDYSNDRIEIPLSKVKLIAALVGAVVFVLLGIAFVINPDTFARTARHHRPIAFILGIGLASIVFFGLCAVIVAFKLFDKKPAIVIDDKGIVINAVSDTFIAWTDIYDLSVRRIKRTQILMLHINEPEAFIKNEKSAFKRAMMSLSNKMYNSPVGITSNALKCNFDELYALIDSKIKQ